MQDEILIARWKVAYEAYNYKPAPEITYRYGWYRIQNNFSQPFRHWKLERITETLEERTGIRKTLEQEVLKRLIMRSCDMPIMKRAIRLKPTSELEDTLRRMKEGGR